MPKDETLLIGEKVPDTHLWSLNYSIFLDNEKDIDKVVEILKDVYQQIK